MNENTPMTPAQQLFAEEHHNLVYAFLNEKKLPEDELLPALRAELLAMKEAKGE